MADRLIALLATIADPVSGKPLPDSGRLEGVSERDGTATVVLKVPQGGDDGSLKKAIEKTLKKDKAVKRVRLITTMERAQKSEAPKRPVTPPQGKRPAKRIIAVAAGKGGVGKSTVTANLAAAYAKQGLKVGVLDADVYGPSIPRLLGLRDVPGLQKNEAGIQPAEAHGIKVVSMGFLTKPGAAVVWRGPMVQGAITQFLNETVWNEPDVLLIDMPPGTGDAQLAIAQTAAVDGAVIAVTPQDLALDDAKKAMAMFQQTHTPILGLIENMSVFLCPHCGEPSEIFGHGGARAEAEAMGVPFLGEIPLHIDLRKRSDEGRPVAFDDGPVAKAFERLAEGVLTACDEARKPLPEIVFS